MLVVHPALAYKLWLHYNTKTLVYRRSIKLHAYVVADHKIFWRRERAVRARAFVHAPIVHAVFEVCRATAIEVFSPAAAQPDLECCLVLELCGSAFRSPPRRRPRSSCHGTPGPPCARRSLTARHSPHGVRLGALPPLRAQR